MVDEVGHASHESGTARNVWAAFVALESTMQGVSIPMPEATLSATVTSCQRKKWDGEQVN
jgi:hypothetical protein